MEEVRIAIFASGSGTNAENIIRYFKSHQQISVGLVISNKAEAGVLQKAESHNVPALAITNEQLRDSETILSILHQHQIHFIALAGFLKLIPGFLVKAYPRKIVNIHPALLPDYGGKGMYGKKVHQAVKANGDPATGITIHYVNEAYDEGAIIFQKSTPIDPQAESVEKIEQKVHQLEYDHYPQVIEEVIQKELLTPNNANF